LNDNESDEQKMIFLANASVEYIAMMIKCQNTLAALLTMMGSQWLIAIAFSTPHGITILVQVMINVSGIASLNNIKRK